MAQRTAGQQYSQRRAPPRVPHEQRGPPPGKLFASVSEDELHTLQALPQLRSSSDVDMDDFLDEVAEQLHIQTQQHDQKQKQQQQQKQGSQWRSVFERSHSTSSAGASPCLMESTASETLASLGQAARHSARSSPLHPVVERASPSVFPSAFISPAPSLDTFVRSQHTRLPYPCTRSETSTSSAPSAPASAASASPSSSSLRHPVSHVSRVAAALGTSCAHTTDLAGGGRPAASAADDDSGSDACTTLTTALSADDEASCLADAAGPASASASASGIDTDSVRSVALEAGLALPSVYATKEEVAILAASLRRMERKVDWLMAQERRQQQLLRQHQQQQQQEQQQQQQSEQRLHARAVTTSFSTSSPTAATAFYYILWVPVRKLVNSTPWPIKQVLLSILDLAEEVVMGCSWSVGEASCRKVSVGPI